MVRIKRGKIVRKKHKKLRKLVKGFRTIRKTRIRKAREALMKAWGYAYRDRRTKKREFRRLWITRLNAAVREHGIKYSDFIKKLSDKKIMLDRKVLSELAQREPEVFGKIVEEAKK